MGVGELPAGPDGEPGRLLNYSACKVPSVVFVLLTSGVPTAVCVTRAVEGVVLTHSGLLNPHLSPTVGIMAPLFLFSFPFLFLLPFPFLFLFPFL